MSMSEVHEVRVVPPVEGDLRRLAACHYDVWLDGRRITPSRVTIDLDASGVPEVTLDFPHVTVSSFEGTARVVLAPGLEDALLGLGWTPPADDDRRVNHRRDCLALLSTTGECTCGGDPYYGPGPSETDR